jgi:hypothetical protein
VNKWAAPAFDGPQLQAFILASCLVFRETGRSTLQIALRQECNYGLLLGNSCHVGVLPTSACEVGSQGPPLCDPETKPLRSVSTTRHRVRRDSGLVLTPLPDNWFSLSGKAYQMEGA